MRRPGRIYSLDPSMRNAFFLLVLANLAFAAWHSWYSPSRVLHAADTDLPKLTLVREVPPEVADRREANAAAPAVHLPTDDAALAKAQESGGTALLAAPQPAPTASARPSPTTPVPTTLVPTSPGPSATAPARSSSSSSQPASSTFAPATSSARDAAGVARCTSVGPFRDLAQAAT